MRSFLFFVCLCLAFSASSQLSRTDSLNGFNVTPFVIDAHQRNFDQNDMRYFIKQKENAFIRQKYNIAAEAEQSNARPGAGNAVANAPCLDEDFETLSVGSLATGGWTASTANMLSSPVCVVLSGFTNNNATAIVATTPITDANCNNVPSSPFGGTKILTLNKMISTINSRVRQTFSVTNTNFIYEYAYKGFSNGGGHQCCDAPNMLFNFYNCSGALIGALSKTVVPGGLCGPAPANWITGTSGFYTPNWVVSIENLSSYIGSCITVEVIASNCTGMSHNGYLYYDAKCANSGLMIDDNVVTTPSYTTCSPSATLSGLSGFSSYLWQGPTGSGISGSTNSLITTSTPGNYTLTALIGTLVTTQTVNLVLNSIGNVSISGASSVCATNSIALQAIGGGLLSYTWTTGANSQSIVAAPGSSTIISVSATNSVGCISSGSLNINVFQNSPVSIQSPTLTICRGDAVPLLASSNTASTYVWNTGATVASITVSPIVTTTYFATVTTQNGCVSTTSVVIAVLVPPLSQISVNSSTMCEGQTVVLTANATLVMSYLWSNQATAQTISVSPLVSTVYTLQVTSTSGCTNTGSTTITVFPSPQLLVTASPTLVCEGQPVVFTASGSNVSSFLWNNGGTNSSSTQSAGINSVYSVTATSANGCVASAIQTISVKPAPTLQVTVSNSIICPGQNVVLTASTGSVASYQWSGGQNTPFISVSPFQTTSYTVTATVFIGNGCASSVVKTIQVAACTGINDNTANSNSEIRVFPNPAIDSFFIKSVKKESGVIIDELGRVVKEFNLNTENNFSQSFNGFASGVYFVKAKGEVLKVIVN